VGQIKRGQLSFAVNNWSTELHLGKGVQDGQWDEAEMQRRSPGHGHCNWVGSRPSRVSVSIILLWNLCCCKLGTRSLELLTLLGRVTGSKTSGSGHGSQVKSLDLVPSLGQSGVRVVTKLTRLPAPLQNHWVALGRYWVCIPKLFPSPVPPCRRTACCLHRIYSKN